MTEKVSRPIAAAIGVETPKHPKVLVRSAFDDLSVLRAIRAEGPLVVVASEDREHTMGVPRTHVFGYSEDVEKQLKNALAANDAQLVASIWDQLDPVEDGFGAG